MEKLEKIIRKVGIFARKAIATAPLALALAGQMYSPKEAEADVLFSIETSNVNDFPTRSFANDSLNRIKVNVYAETTGTNEISGLSWKLMPPSNANMVASSIPQPNPYVNGSQDFFSPYNLSDLNFTSINENWRFLSTPQIPRNKKGIVGTYIFDIDSNTPFGKKDFKIINTEAYNENYDLLPSKGTQTSVDIIPDYSPLTYNPKVFMELNKIPGKNQDVPYLFVDSHIKNKKFVLEASSDMKTWTPLKTNETYDSSLQMWLPYSFRDDSSTNNPSRFYRAKSQ